MPQNNVPTATHASPEIGGLSTGDSALHAHAEAIEDLADFVASNAQIAQCYLNWVAGQNGRIGHDSDLEAPGRSGHEFHFSNK